MSEPFDAIEEVIRRLGQEVTPAVSLRQRILAASQMARERQLNRIRLLRASGWTSICLFVIYAGAQVQWNDFQPLSGLTGSGLSIASAPIVKDLSDSVVGVQTALASRGEVSSPIFGDPIEWETADSAWRRRDRQSTVISHYF